MVVEGRSHNDIQDIPLPLAGGFFLVILKYGLFTVLAAFEHGCSANSEDIGIKPMFKSSPLRAANVELLASMGKLLPPSLCNWPLPP